MSQEIEQLRFIVDRSLGSEKVPKALREADFELVTLDELYGKRGAEDKKDEEWLEDAGKKGLVVLTKDRRIKQKPAERAMILECNVRCFCVTRSKDLYADELAGLFIMHKEAIYDACLEPGPFFYAVRSDKIERLDIPPAQPVSI